MYGAWRWSAACRGADPSLFEPHREGDVASQRARTAAALEFCAACPVVEACRAEFAALLDVPQVGVYAGQYVNAEEAFRRRRVARKAVGLSRQGPREHPSGLPLAPLGAVPAVPAESAA